VTAARRGLVALAAAAALAACFSDRPSATGPQVGDCRVEGGIPFTDSLHHVVLIRDFAFHPAQLAVRPGATVTWVNCERESVAQERHTTTSDGGLWDSGLLSVGEVFSRRFDAAGSFPYHCQPHPGMRAEVRVE
jgi:plastocyanin